MFTFISFTFKTHFFFIIPQRNHVSHPAQSPTRTFRRRQPPAVPHRPRAPAAEEPLLPTTPPTTCVASHRHTARRPLAPPAPVRAPPQPDRRRRPPRQRHRRRATRRQCCRRGRDRGGRARLPMKVSNDDGSSSVKILMLRVGKPKTYQY